MCGLVLIAGCENKPRELLNNPKEIKQERISGGDSYWEYAGELISNCPQLKKLDKREIVYYLKHELNEDKELYAGKKVKFPEYDCK